MNKKGVLLVNLGSPDSTDPKDVKRYLDEFLMDPRVIDVPFWLRAFIVRGIVLNTRPKKSAAAYKKIWWKEGSPLIVLSERFAQKVQENIGIPAQLAMRYGKPSIAEGLESLHKQGVQEVLLFPLYPQFAMATTETIIVLVKELIAQRYPEMQLTIVPPFYNHTDYIRSLSNSISESLFGYDFDHLIFSYHGVPERHIKKSDITKSHCKIDGSCCVTPSKAHRECYRHQCFETTRLVCESLGIPKEKTTTSFQSRLGFDPWLKPYTDRSIERLGIEGVQKLAIVTPAFVTDCLETLEEIAMEGAELFQEVGGKSFKMIPCLNDRDEWVNVVARWVDEWAFAAAEQ
ncbi:MAG: ferrochelatase, partial [Flavobacteriaceae bacterium]|nr:ferrochelatase [Flavobacteriaceae bacterium]